MTKNAAREEEKVLSSTATLHVGDCLAALPTLAQWSCHCCVTDPPYELEFMGKDWDGTGVAFDPATWRAVKRCVTPGGYLLAFGGTRTFHRIMCAIEDAGWELIDTLMWLHGQGFPKGQGQLKPAWEPIILARRPSAKVTPLGIDECRVPTSGEHTLRTQNEGPEWSGKFNGGRRVNGSTVGRYPANLVHDGSHEVMEAFAASGQVGGGFGTENRVGSNGRYGAFSGKTKGKEVGFGDSGTAARFFYCAKASRKERGEGLDNIEIVSIECHQKRGGKWESVAPEVKLRVDMGLSPPKAIGECGVPENYASEWNMILFGSSTTASSLTVWKSITATKTNSTTESRTLNWLTRLLINASIPVVNSETDNGGNRVGSAEKCSLSLSITNVRVGCLPGVRSVALETRLTIKGNAGNAASHPCVKPLALMRWLVRLVCPPGGICLDPFAGSGTTGLACLYESRNAVLVEREPAYADIIRARLRGAKLGNRLVEAANVSRS